MNFVHTNNHIFNATTQGTTIATPITQGSPKTRNGSNIIAPNTIPPSTTSTTAAALNLPLSAVQTTETSLSNSCSPSSSHFIPISSNLRSINQTPSSSRSLHVGNGRTRRGEDLSQDKQNDYKDLLGFLGTGPRRDPMKLDLSQRLLCVTSQMGAVNLCSSLFVPPNEFDVQQSPCGRSVFLDSNRNNCQGAQDSDILCPYFIFGICRFGSNCRYSHEPLPQRGLLPVRSASSPSLIGNATAASLMVLPPVPPPPPAPLMAPGSALSIVNNYDIGIGDHINLVSNCNPTPYNHHDHPLHYNDQMDRTFSCGGLESTATAKYSNMNSTCNHMNMPHSSNNHLNNEMLDKTNEMFNRYSVGDSNQNCCRNFEFDCFQQNSSSSSSNCITSNIFCQNINPNNSNPLNNIGYNNPKNSSINHLCNSGSRNVNINRAHNNNMNLNYLNNCNNDNTSTMGSLFNGSSSGNIINYQQQMQQQWQQGLLLQSLQHQQQQQQQLQQHHQQQSHRCAARRLLEAQLQQEHQLVNLQKLEKQKKQHQPQSPPHPQGLVKVATPPLSSRSARSYEASSSSSSSSSSGSKHSQQMPQPFPPQDLLPAMQFPPQQIQPQFQNQFMPQPVVPQNLQFPAPAPPPPLPEHQDQLPQQQMLQRQLLMNPSAGQRKDLMNSLQYFATGSIFAFCPFEPPCPFGRNCAYVMHMQQCSMCDKFCLNPNDAEQRRQHHAECVKEHEQAMEYSFAIARSKDKICSICYDPVLKKSGREKRFGILPNCNHIFCLECIKKWRQEKNYELNRNIIRSCPMCRVSSDYVYPCAFWIESEEEKKKLLNEYRSALGRIDCKYFKKGEGKCPFGNKCFYKHALSNGELIDVDLQSRLTTLYRRQ